MEFGLSQELLTRVEGIRCQRAQSKAGESAFTPTGDARRIKIIGADAYQSEESRRTTNDPRTNNATNDATYSESVRERQTKFAAKERTSRFGKLGPI